MQLSVIIVNYNVKYFLEQCLHSVLKASHNIEAEILVVDNNSTDGSKTYLEPLFKTVKFIYNKENRGFAKANNQALAESQGDYILFLNPDTIVPEDGFEKCISFLKSSPDIGALGVRMVDGSGKFLKESKRAFPSPLTSLYKLTGLTGLFPHSKVFAKYYLGHLNEKEDHEVDVLAGAFMMIPRHVLDKTGGFDEIFFMYGEDVDLSYRIQQTGFKNIYFAQTDIIHFKGESTRKGSLNYVRLFYKAMSLFVKKHYSSGKAGLFIFLIQIAIWFRALIAVVGGLFRHKERKITKGERAKDRPGRTVHTIIISNERDFVFMTGLMQRSGIIQNETARVNNTTDVTDGALGNMKQLPQLIKKYDVQEIIFCENGSGFKEIISTIQELPEGIRNKFHASGSNSIIGSDDRNKAGDFIAEKK